MTANAKQHSAKNKQQVITEFRRREILDAARKIFARKGFADGIVDDIASRPRRVSTSLCCRTIWKP
jgi:AcrR family transcriptional regulator